MWDVKDLFQFVSLGAFTGARRAISKICIFSPSILFHKAFVVSHHHVGLNLLHCVNCYTNNNQERGTAEVQIHVGHAHEDGWKYSNAEPRNRPPKKVIRLMTFMIYSLVGAAWTDTRDEPTVFADIISHIDWVEGN